jgi:predicted Co/Zn/Cd cation transporter (cation efflux family)
VNNMSNSMKLVLGGIALMVIGVFAFLHSLGSGGEYGATLTFIAGAVVLLIGCVKYFLKKRNKTP